MDEILLITGFTGQKFLDLNEIEKDMLLIDVGRRKRALEILTGADIGQFIADNQLRRS